MINNNLSQENKIGAIAAVNKYGGYAVACITEGSGTKMEIFFIK